MRFHTELKQTVLNSWYVETMGVHREGKRAFYPVWKLGLSNGDSKGRPGWAMPP